jgi:hypothetical protein
MEPRHDRLQDRILPALLTALGVTFLGAGLLTWTAPVEAGPTATVPDGGATATPASPTPIGPGITLPPIGSAPPSSASPDAFIVEPSDTRVATRVRIRDLDIDLPVVLPPGGSDEYPLCDVAMYIRELSQPGNGKATYLYAHARPGMFEPLLRTKARDQLGLRVEVWTNDNLRFVYEITEVRRDQRNPTAFNDAIAADSEQLWLQTSEGPRGTPGKTQVVAMFRSVERSSEAAAHPDPKPVACE